MSTVQYYELSLKWLSIPNQLLKTGYGGYLNNYPYLYVRFYNEGSISTITNMVSNNPNSAIAVFKVPIADYILDRPTSFWTLKGDDRSQIIAFRPDQPIRVVITLPDGKTIYDQSQDLTSPSPSNPLLQVNLSVNVSPVNYRYESIV